jgi:hypothetical protein
MSKERFEGLRQGLIEAGPVMRGERRPSREFTYFTSDGEMTVIPG